MPPQSGPGHRVVRLLTCLALVAFSPASFAEDSHPLAEVSLRPIGPAITSGRIADFASLDGDARLFSDTFTVGTYPW